VRYPMALGSIAAIVLLAGCGGGSKSTAGTAGTGTTSGGAGGYGGGAAASTGTKSTAAATSPGAAGGTVTVTTKPNKLGTILAAGPKQRTVYIYEADKGSTSSCSAACAAVWPPVGTSAAATAAGGALSADIGVITRSDGSKQVTYKGHPLYLYARDGDKSDAYGQGIKSFGASWYVLAPSGNKIDKS
jgi:predicted lipoprotein with Yx(FWY)xxD motif